ncbi:MAG: glycosyltransferase family 2 protein, partial [Bacteroidetes bacterium]|nr:glycosyltransferase family 2 protein [Bacteroidota bacterium]
MNIPAYSIIVPVFNSEPSLEELFEGIRSVFAEIGETFEVIFVDDHSKDQSWEVLKKIKATHPELVTAITLRKNFGQHNATFCGFSFVQGSFVITIDDDLQNPPAEIRKLITEQQHTDADIVYGFYPQKKANFFRRLGSRSVKQSSGFLRDTLREGSSFRLIRRELVDRLLDSAQHFLFIDEMLQWYTDSIRLVEVKHLPRKYARSNYSS